MRRIGKVALTAGSVALIGSAFQSHALADEHGYSDTEDHWAEAEIHYLSDSNYLSGYPDGSFQPDGQITRAEAASVMFHQQELSEFDADFSDVSQYHWAFGEIGAVQEAEIMIGYTDDTFLPETEVTRAEVAKLISNTFDYELDGESSHPFPDVSEDHWASDEIQALQDHHLLNGYSDGTYRPDNSISRAEFSAVVARVLNEDFREDVKVNMKSDRLLEAIMEEDFETVSDYAHPTEGIRFSPYVYVQSDDQVFDAAGLEDWLADETIYTWGAEDGTGDPIEKTTQEYHERYLINNDYQNPDERVYNEETDRGNTKSNIKEFFPDAKFVEYYVSGEEDDYAGMDWGSTTLVMQEHDGDWYLIAVVNDEWTI